MGGFIEQLGQQGAAAAGSVIGTGMGLLLEKHNDKRQIEQQKKLQQLQMQGQMQMGEFNYDQQMKMWDATNYSAQMAQMKKAGVNPAMMYGIGGGGGTTAQSTPGNVSGEEAPKGGGEVMGGMGLMLQNSLLEAQRRNIEAQTKEIESRIPVNEATVPKLGAETKSITQGINNAIAAEALTKAQTNIAGLTGKYLEKSMDDRLMQTAADAQTAIQEAQQAVAQTTVDQATIQEKIKILQQEAIGAVLKNALTTAQTQNTKSETTLNRQALSQNIEKMAIQWTELGVDQQRIAKELREAGVSASDELMNGIQNAILMILAAKSAGGKSAPKPITGFHR